MPSQDLKAVFDKKPVNFTIKTPTGKWQCTLHGDRATYEKTRGVAPAPGISRSDSGLSVSSTSSSGSSSSH